MKYSEHLWSNAYYHICTIHVTIIYLGTIHISNITWSRWKYTICNIQNLCYLNAEENSKLVFFPVILSLVYLPGLTLETMIFNSTYFSPPFHASSLFAFPAHLKQEYLQISFSTHYLEGQSAYLKGQEYPQAAQPLMSPVNSSLSWSQGVPSGFPNTPKSVSQDLCVS